MKVFVLGAGASIHAGYPSGATIGEKLAAWADLDETEGAVYREDLKKLRAEFGGLDDFEQIATVLREDKRSGKRTRIPDLGSAISHFFNSTRNGPADLYDRMAREYVRRGDVIITFNYDLAVERSLKAAEMWEVNDGYGTALVLRPEVTQLSAVSVLKLHGSTNWWGALFGGALGYGAAQNSVGDRPVLFYESDFKFLGYDDLRDSKAPSNSALLNSLIWPNFKKEFFLKTTFGNEWQEFWNSLWLDASRALHAADEIIVIGYSLLPADERARDLLLHRGNRDALVTVCCHSQSLRIADEFRSNDFKKVIVPSAPTFTGWLDTASYARTVTAA